MNLYGQTHIPIKSTNADLEYAKSELTVAKNEIVNLTKENKKLAEVNRSNSDLDKVKGELEKAKADIANLTKENVKLIDDNKKLKKPKTKAKKKEKVVEK